MSYLKQQFINYLLINNNGSPGNYCNGLDNVEKLFDVNIDDEYRKDQCESLYNLLQDTRKNPERVGKKEHHVRTYASRLKKYIEFRKSHDNQQDRFTWIPFYEEFASKLLEFKNNRKDLLDLIKSCYEKLSFIYPFKEKDEDYEDIDPFTVFGTFNKKIRDDNRLAIIREYKKAFSINAEIPEDFDGVPLLMNLSAWFFDYKAVRGADDINNLWQLFEIALAYADDNSKEQDFIDIYDVVIKQRQIKWNITMGLFWIRPKTFLTLDSNSRSYLPIFNPPVGMLVNVKEVPSGSKYLFYLDEFKKSFAHSASMAGSFYELSFMAFEYDKNIVDSVDEQSEEWWPLNDELELNISKDDWKKYILEVEKPEHPYPMQMLKAMMELGGEASCTQLAKEFGGSSKRYTGCAMNIGRRVKNYFNLPPFIVDGQEKYYPFVFLGKDAGHEYIYKIRPELYNALLEIDLSDISEFFKEDDTSFLEKYDKEKFLSEVYITNEKYQTCVSRLKHKKNIILQGAPGVGKTFAAKRLAWSIMNVKDNSRIEFVQFHQNYSYEDFIMGYKPFNNGFKLEEGIFYKFCMKAKKDPTQDYFFIIDEINRGNMSKIFGELLMLIENDYRETEITLAYNQKPFCIPKNLYIIGMMNTADRSLAMIDYALRRRFSFIEMSPGFDSDGFKSYQSKVNNLVFDRLIGRIKALNADIENDPSLGKGFCIGHSYFCNFEENCSDDLLKEVVEFEIIPMLEEYWFDEVIKAQNWSNDLRGVFNG